MTEVTIVAIPAVDEYVWKISSEKVPHLTLLHLGEIDDQDAIGRILEYVEHATRNTMVDFGLTVKRRDTLGPKKADVLFFDVSEPWVDIDEFRKNLLRQNDIQEAYLSSEQYDTWTPHLTLGYPETPAKSDTRDYAGIGYVRFAKIAVWINDYSGPEYVLPQYSELEVQMSEELENFLMHHGVKGMKWGVRKDRSGSVRARSTLSRRDLKDQNFKSQGVSESMSTAYNRTYKAAAGKIRSGIRTINKEYAGQNFRKDSPIRREYYSKISKMMTQELNAASTRKGGSTGGRFELNFDFDISREATPTVTIRRRETRAARKQTRLSAKEARVSRKQDAKSAAAERKEKAKAAKLQHAEDEEITYSVTPVLDRDGFILNFKLPELEMSEELENFLMHHGVKGMKWGIRKDRKSGQPRESRSERRKKRQAAKATKLTQKKPAAGEKIDSPKGSLDKQREQFLKTKKTSELSNMELRFLNERANLEKTYSQIRQSQSTAKKINDKLNQVLSYGETANKAIQFYNSPAGKLLTKSLTKGAKKVTK